jgi:hypothetical protein
MSIDSASGPGELTAPRQTSVVCPEAPGAHAKGIVTAHTNTSK